MDQDFKMRARKTRNLAAKNKIKGNSGTDNGYHLKCDKDFEEYVKEITENPKWLEGWCKDIGNLRWLFEQTPIGRLRWTAYGRLVGLPGENWSSAVEVGQLISLSAQLFALKGCVGFDKLVSSFKNAQQFQQTLFEVVCAHFLFLRPSISSIVFSPESEGRKGTKFPELKFKYRNRWYFVECKTLNPYTHNATKTFNNMCESFKAVVDEFEIPKDVRLDIFVERTPDSRQIDQLKKVLPTLTESAVVQCGPVTLCLSNRTLPPTFSKFNYALGFYNVGPKNPTRLHWSEQYLRISRMDPKLTTKSTALLKEACDQLPMKNKGLIFLQSSNEECAIEAAHAALKRKEYGHIWGIVVAGNPWRIISRGHDQRALVELLG